MTKHMRGVHVARVPMRAVFATSVLVISASFSLLSTHSAAALPLGADDLLKKVVQPVTQLLPNGNSQSPPPNNTQPASGNSSSGNAASQSTAAQSTTVSASPVAENTSVLTDGVDTPSLEPLLPIDTTDIRRPIMPLTHLASTQRTLSSVEGSEQAGPLPIQASEDGWRLFGLAWYWWLVIGGAVAYAGRQIISMRREVATVE